MALNEVKRKGVPETSDAYRTLGRYRLYYHSLNYMQMGTHTGSIDEPSLIRCRSVGVQLPSRSSCMPELKASARSGRCTTQDLHQAGPHATSSMRLKAHLVVLGMGVVVVHALVELHYPRRP